MLTIVEKVIFLQNIDVFADVPSDQLAEMAAIAEQVSFLKGDRIYQQNESSDALYLVLQGEVRLHQGDQEIAVSRDKEAFGVWALFDDTPRVVTATAATDCQLLRIDREEFVDLLADHVQIAQGVLKNLSQRLRSLVAQVQGGQ